jgi:HAD superfamily hydrolase (TIGR01509 family)
MKDIKLAIFDLDGTLIDSTSIWGEIDQIFFQRREKEVPEEYMKEIAHIGLTAAAKVTKEKYFPNEKEEDILKEWNDLSLEAYRYHIPLKDNVKELLDLLASKGITLALATANSEELYKPCIERLDIKKYFSYIIDVNSCSKGKDSPEIFDKVVHHFNLNKEEVIIFEDSLTAMKTGKENGYKVIGVYDKCSTKDIEYAKTLCFMFINDYKELIDKFNW